MNSPDKTLSANGDEVEDANTHKFRSSLTRFAYIGSPPRWSPRIKKCIAEVPQDTKTPCLSRPETRGSNDNCPNNSPKKARRGYAAPETYAHLNFLQDYLTEELDVIFCGINPGYRSAEVGHHFANPTNHFWRCLHRSGFTSHLLDPSEDFTLPNDFQLGLTNLVDRPSVQQAELSLSEMAAAVPSFLAKMLRFRPRIVCFVGLCISQVVRKSLSTSVPALKNADATLPKPSRSGKSRSTSVKVGLQPYKLVYSQRTDTEIGCVSETLFFTMPSTSGRVVSHQLSDKVVTFTELKKIVEDLTEGRLDTSEMSVISKDCLPGTYKVTRPDFDHSYDC